jgi:Spy/CpxP family protein refolding chaperone
MKQLIIYMSFFLLASMAAELQAQQRGMNSGAGLQIGLLYSDQLNLTEDQKMAIARMVVEHRTELREERGDRQRGARFEHRGQLHENIMGILTPQQRTVYEKSMKDAMENRETAHKFRMMAQAELISEETGLSSDQKSKVMAVIASHIDENVKHRQQTRRAAVRPDIDTQIERLEARRDLMNSLKDIMTEEQFAKWEKEWSAVMPGQNMNRPNTERGNERRNRQIRQIHRN